jgi:serine/threonine protein kinase
MKGIKRPFNDEEIAVVTFCVVHGLCCLHDALVLHRYGRFRRLPYLFFFLLLLLAYAKLFVVTFTSRRDDSDVKPDNILVNEKGQAKLGSLLWEPGLVATRFSHHLSVHSKADLGISARAKTREDKRKTVIGTSHYLGTTSPTL